jgi:hypothetical protein
VRRAITASGADLDDPGTGRVAAGQPPATAGPAAGGTGPTAGPVAPVDQPVSLRTEFVFELPRGYVDATGTLHRTGTMRLATARDELVPLRDPRVRENPAYLTVVLLSRVITRLGWITDLHTGIIEELFASDVAFLQDLYRRINSEGHTTATVACPECEHRFDVDLAGGRLGES